MAVVLGSILLLGRMFAGVASTLEVAYPCEAGRCPLSEIMIGTPSYRSPCRLYKDGIGSILTDPEHGAFLRVQVDCTDCFTQARIPLQSPVLSSHDFELCYVVRHHIVTTRPYYNARVWLAGPAPGTTTTPDPACTHDRPSVTARYPRFIYTIWEPQHGCGWSTTNAVVLSGANVCDTSQHVDQVQFDSWIKVCQRHTHSPTEETVEVQYQVLESGATPVRKTFSFPMEPELADRSLTDINVVAHNWWTGHYIDLLNATVEQWPRSPATATTAATSTTTVTTATVTATLTTVTATVTPTATTTVTTATVTAMPTTVAVTATVDPTATTTVTSTTTSTTWTRQCVLELEDARRQLDQCNVNLGPVGKDVACPQFQISTDSGPSEGGTKVEVLFVNLSTGPLSQPRQCGFGANQTEMDEHPDTHRWSCPSPWGSPGSIVDFTVSLESGQLCQGSHTFEWYGPQKIKSISPPHLYTGIHWDGDQREVEVVLDGTLPGSKLHDGSLRVRWDGKCEKAKILSVSRPHTIRAELPIVAGDGTKGEILLAPNRDFGEMCGGSAEDAPGVESFTYLYHFSPGREHWWDMGVEITMVLFAAACSAVGSILTCVIIRVLRRSACCSRVAAADDGRTI